MLKGSALMHFYRAGIRAVATAFALYAYGVTGAPQAAAQGVIYAVKNDGDLLWAKHLGHNDGTFKWQTDFAQRVGNGWNFKQVFGGCDGVIYAIKDDGDLLWYKHLGRNDGTFKWQTDFAQRVGNGWNVKQAFGE